jgi:uncharacterized protein YecE (DUF72 family)
MILRAYVLLGIFILFVLDANHGGKNADTVLSLLHFPFKLDPRIQSSNTGYHASQIADLAARIRGYEDGKTWVDFDNTAAGVALSNALELMKLCT